MIFVIESRNFVVLLRASWFPIRKIGGDIQHDKLRRYAAFFRKLATQMHFSHAYYQTAV